MAAIVGSVAMNDFLAALLISLFFISGFWLGVNWYKNQIINEVLNETKSR